MYVLSRGPPRQWLNIIAAAARMFQVPKSTLYNRLSERIHIGAKVGHSMNLTAAEEEEITETCILFADWGFSLGRCEVGGVIQDFLKSTKRKNPFKGVCQGRGGEVGS